MTDFDKEFIMDLFLDDNVSQINRTVLCAANILKENHENISRINNIIAKENFIQEARRFSKNVPPKQHTACENKNFYESVILKYTDEDYILKFMMKKSTVHALVNHLQDFMKPGASIPLDKKIHIFLWLLTSNSSFNDVAKLFNLHKSSVSYIFYEISSLLSEQRYHFISWPSLEEQHVTRIKVNSRYGFPNCVGFIDACRLKIGSKLNQRYKPEIILLQAVCGETLMFYDIHIGDIGNTHKSRVFKDSQLAHELKNFIDFDNHILGSCEYKLRKNLITPFTSDEVLTNEEMKFNEIHWKTCTYIGHAFELLKERFKKLNRIDINKSEAIKTLICAACVLHNFVLLHEGNSYLKEETVISEDGVTIDPSIVKTAVEKRQFLCNYINFINSS